jgi:uncharacterized membrane protein (UPF0127 family)
MVKRFLLLFVMGVMCAAFPARAEMAQIITLDGRSHLFQVTLADTPEEQARGLMHVTHLPLQNGMLFPMSPPRKARFWMRNTMIPLDMIFIRPGGEIAQITTRRDTQSDAQSVSIEPVSAVLELNAGEAARLKIGIGDRLIMAGQKF